MFFKSKLLQRYSLLLVLIFSVMGISYLLLSLGLSNYYLQQVQTKINLHAAETLIEDNELVRQGKLNEEALETTFHRYMVLNPNLEIYLVDLSGKILKFSADADKIKRHHINLRPLKDFLNHPTLDHFMQGDDPRSFDEKKPFSVALLPNAQYPEAYLYVIIHPHIAEVANRRLQESILLKLSGWSFLSSLILGLLLGGILFYHLSKRIHRLSTQVAAFKKQSDNIILPPKAINDDLDELAQATSEMSIQLNQQLVDILQTDEQRRFMISSLSHDLRTPLTNLLGYIEQGNQEQSDPYLNIAFQNGLKLKHYLDRLFELSKLDGNLLELHFQELSLTEFCHDIFQQYQSHYPDKDWQFVRDNQPLNCEFDSIQLESALRNLLDNASRHGQGKIELRLKQHDKKVMIQVSSDGEDLSDKLRSLVQQDKTARFISPNSFPVASSGLGLLIIQTIVKKHGGTFYYQRQGSVNCFVMTLTVPPSTYI